MTGKTIARYELATRQEIADMGGRLPFPKEFKEKISKFKRCWLGGTRFELRYLQIDHLVSFSISGDVEDMEPSHFMLLCGSCNRSKSWSCERCPNWKKEQNAETCKSCYWATPESHDHVATIRMRRLDVTWQGNVEVESYDSMVRSAESIGQNLPDYINEALRRQSNGLDNPQTDAIN